MENLEENMDRNLLISMGFGFGLHTQKDGQGYTHDGLEKIKWLMEPGRKRAAKSIVQRWSIVVLITPTNPRTIYRMHMMDLPSILPIIVTT
jgi:hypothetical protein